MQTVAFRDLPIQQPGAGQQRAPGPHPPLDQRAADRDAEQPDEREPFEPSIVREHGQVREEGIPKSEPEHEAAQADLFAGWLSARGAVA